MEPERMEERKNRAPSFSAESLTGLVFRSDVPFPSFPPVLDSKAIDSNQPMNALMRLNQIRPGLQYRLLSQSGPVHAPVFTMSVDLDGTVYEASGSSKKTAKLHVAVKVNVGKEE